VTFGVEIDAERIATAVQTARHIAGLDSGRYGEIATYLPGRRVGGVRAAVGPLDRPLHVHINDLHIISQPSSPAVVPRRVDHAVNRS
jgi:hypothetical protein